jgi:hypothetical protein
MKKLILPILMLMTFKVVAQKFEGTIQWSMKTEITDPKKKAQFEEAQKRMNDPANQAKMKEMEARMNDPQFKAMLENNPQMKTQMTQAMAAMRGGSMVPTGMKVKIKGANTITTMDGSMVGSEILYLQDKDQSFSVDRQNKTYAPLPNPGETVANSTSNVNVTKTEESIKILGYNCTKYIVESTVNGKPIKQSLWATTEIKDLDLNGLWKNHFGKGKLYFDKIQGVPLKFEITNNDALVTMEVTAIKREPLNADEFVIPADYKQISFMGR